MTAGGRLVILGSNVSGCQSWHPPVQGAVAALHRTVFQLITDLSSEALAETDHCSLFTAFLRIMGVDVLIDVEAVGHLVSVAGKSLDLDHGSSASPTLSLRAPPRDQRVPVVRIVRDGMPLNVSVYELPVTAV